MMTLHLTHVVFTWSCGQNRNMITVEPKNRTEWRAWLAAHHDKEAEIWLVYYKKGTGKESVDYEASVEEALCFGWIDSIIKKLDETKYVRKFTPRKEKSRWCGSGRYEESL